MTEDVLFENLDYGIYELVYPHSYEFSENVKYGSAEFNKLHVRRVRLPEGKNNIIYLLTDSFDSGIRLVNSGNFLIPPGYRKIYYPVYSIGSFMKKRYRLLLTGKKNMLDKGIKERTRFIPYQTRKLSGSNENIFFLTGDLYDITKPIVEKIPVKRCYTEYFSEFGRILKSMTPPIKDTDKDKGSAWNNRVLIIDCDSFGFKPGASLKDNKTNPLYLLYLGFFRNKTMATMNVDMDMMICSKNLFMKFNPAHTDMNNWSVFKRALFRIINANLDDYTENLSDSEKSELEENEKDTKVSNLISNAIAPYTKNLSGSAKASVKDIVETKMRSTAAKKALLDKEIKDAVGKKELTSTPGRFSVLHKKPGTLSKKEEQLFKAIGGYQYQALTSDTGEYVDDDDIDEVYADDVEEDATEILTKDEDVAEEILDEVQENIVPVKINRNAPINSKRDEKLREEQKKVVVRTETIEQILDRDISNVPIQETDKSKVMHTANDNMKNIKFGNFEKTYLDELYDKDLVSCFDMLKDKDSPFFVTGIDIKDTSTNLDYKETWTVHLKDETGKRHTVKVDIPKFQNDRFMYIGGTKYMILKQNFYNPLVKDTPDTVILTTNYNKITITRKATKSTNSIEKIFSLIKKTGDTKVFVPGDPSKINMKYISTLEYDELSRRLYQYSSNGCDIYFSRSWLEENMTKPSDLKGNEFVIGKEGNSFIIINEDTGLDRQGRTIIDIMYSHFPENYKKIFDAAKGPTQSMYVEGKLAGQFIPIIVTLVVWDGLKKTLDNMKIRWKFTPNAKRVPAGTTGTKYIRFADGLLEYEAGMFTELMLNGLSKLHPEKLKFEDFETEEAYSDYVYAVWGSYNGINELDAFREFLVDPITKQVCRDYSLPDTASGLLIHAVKLLCDNAYVNKASDKSYRVRSIEMIPAILYSCLAAQYKAYTKSGRRLPFTLNQRCVIQKLIAEKTVEAYSTLNPVVEVTKAHTVSTKGYKGSNSERSYDQQKRSYDPSSIGKLAMSTSPKPSMHWVIKIS